MSVCGMFRDGGASSGTGVLIRFEVEVEEQGRVDEVAEQVQWQQMSRRWTVKRDECGHRCVN